MSAVVAGQLRQRAERRGVIIEVGDSQSSSHWTLLEGVSAAESVDCSATHPADVNPDPGAAKRRPPRQESRFEPPTFESRHT